MTDIINSQYINIIIRNVIMNNNLNRNYFFTIIVNTVILNSFMYYVKYSNESNGITYLQIQGDT